MRTPVLPLPGVNQLHASRYGYCLVNRHDTVVGQSIATYGEYFETEVDLFRQLCRPGDLVVDVGANIGTHTLALARLVGPNGFVYALEPQRVIFQILCANMALNSLSHVECVHAAAGAVTGFLHMPDLDYTRPANFGGAGAVPSSTGRRVRQLRLDDLIEGQPVSLIKVDVEGMERDVLEGARGLITAQRPWLYVENDRLANSRPLLETLFSLGYRLYWHFPVFYNPNNFYQNPVRIHNERLIDRGDHFGINGIAINLFGVPAERNVSIVGTQEVRGPDEHPLKKDCPLLSGLPVVDRQGVPVKR